MLPESLTGVFAGLESLSAGAGILVLLGILSVWVWTLIILTSLGLREAMQAKKGIVIEHAKFCQSMSCCRLGGKLRLRVMRAHMQILLRQVSKNVGTILLLSSLAPLIGLLGTVEGMICTFRALAETGAASSASLTEGVSQALVTTQGGLLVAIPSLLAGAVLRRKTQKLRNTLQSASLRADNEGQHSAFHTEGHNEMA